VKLYLFKSDFVGYDIYVGFVIRAKTRKDAMSIANKVDRGGRWGVKECTHLASNVKGKAGVVLDSFIEG